MFKFHYNHIKEIYGNDATLLFTDTDSLTYHIKTDDIYKDMREFPKIYDTSDYPPNHPSYSLHNKKEIGCFKDELNSEPIIQFVGLKAKMYSILAEKSEKRTAKGVNRNVLKHKIRHNHYLECLRNPTVMRNKQFNIQSINHHLHTVSVNKVSLSAFDDKRFLMKGGIKSYAYGHYKIKNVK